MQELGYEDFVKALETDRRELVQLERPRPHCAVLRMNDPEHQNALSGALTVQLHRALREVCHDPTVRTIVLTGSGGWFSVGGDWELMRDRAHTYANRPEGTTGLWKWIRYQFGGIARLIVESDKVVISALNGAAAGVALAWALSSDLLLASREARLVTAFGRIGLVPEVGTNWALTRRLGYPRAFALFLRGDVVDAARALELGLVNEVTEPASLLPSALEWSERVEGLPEHVVAMAKPLMRHASDMTWQQTLLAEEFAEPNTFTTRAHQETVRALLGKTTMGA